MLVVKSIINDFGWELELNDEENLLNEEVINVLKKTDNTIYWNNTDSDYWMFDFKINDIWFDPVKISFNKKKIIFNVWK